MCWKCDHPDSTMQEWMELIYAAVQENGWVVQFISDRTPFAYTIGLHERGLPELLVTRMPPERARLVLDSVAHYLVKGGRPVPGERMLVGGELDLWPPAGPAGGLARRAGAPAVVRGIQQRRGATAGVRRAGRPALDVKSTLARRHSESSRANVDSTK
jgi:hypothetical protein